METCFSEIVPNRALFSGVSLLALLNTYTHTAGYNPGPYCDQSQPDNPAVSNENYKPDRVKTPSGFKSKFWCECEKVFFEYDLRP